MMLYQINCLFTGIVKGFSEFLVIYVHTRALFSEFLQLQCKQGFSVVRFLIPPLHTKIQHMAEGIITY